jgi:hypothetical protein
MNKKSRGIVVVGVEQQGGASGGVERLGGIVVTTKDER